MKKIANYKEQSSLINAIIFLVLGIILFTNPGGIVKFISYFIGGALIIPGIFNILSYKKTLKKLNIEEKSKLVSGIILIILGLISIIFSSFIEGAVRLICGCFILYSGITKLINTINNKGEKLSFIVSLCISILMILCGFYVVLTANLIFKFIGLFVLIYAVMEITSYIFNSLKTK